MQIIWLPILVDVALCWSKNCLPIRSFKKALLPAHATQCALGVPVVGYEPARRPPRGRGGTKTEGSQPARAASCARGASHLGPTQLRSAIQILMAHPTDQAGCGPAGWVFEFKTPMGYKRGTCYRSIGRRASAGANAFLHMSSLCPAGDKLFHHSEEGFYYRQGPSSWQSAILQGRSSITCTPLVTNIMLEIRA